MSEIKNNLNSETEYIKNVLFGENYVTEKEKELQEEANDLTGESEEDGVKIQKESEEGGLDQELNILKDKEPISLNKDQNLETSKREIEDTVQRESTEKQEKEKKDGLEIFFTEEKSEVLENNNLNSYALKTQERNEVKGPYEHIGLDKNYYQEEEKIINETERYRIIFSLLLFFIILLSVFLYYFLRVFIIS